MSRSVSAASLTMMVRSISAGEGRDQCFAVVTGMSNSSARLARSASARLLPGLPGGLRTSSRLGSVSITHRPPDAALGKQPRYGRAQGAGPDQPYGLAP